MDGILREAREKHGLLCLTDIVLNHTANNSDWLQDHPEAGYSPFNTPHLAPALEIDDAVIKFSAELGSQGLPSRLATSSDLDRVMDALKSVLEGLSLWQYYVLDVSLEREEVRRALDLEDFETFTERPVANMDVLSLANFLKHEGYIQGLGSLSNRFCVKVDPGLAASMIKAAFVEIWDKDALVEAWVRVVDVLNADLYEEANQDLSAAIDGIRNRAAYTRLDANGPKLGDISAR
jgi:glycogen debranching enzyme